MALVVESVSTTDGSGTSIVIDKPTGLAVGDYMLALISLADTDGGNVNTPSGWTSITAQGTSDSLQRALEKVATSDDVSASNFTFTLSGGDIQFIRGTIMRISGAPTSSQVDVSNSQVYASTAITGISFSTSLDAAVDGSLIVLMFTATTQGATGAGSIGTYVTSDGSLSFTEMYDQGNDSGTLDPIFGAAYAIQSTATTITSYGATLSLSRADHVGSIIVIKPAVDATGTNDLLDVSPTFFSQAGSASTTGTNDLFAVSPEFFTQSGKKTSPSQWTEQTKNTSTWTNLPKSI